MDPIAGDDGASSFRDGRAALSASSHPTPSEGGFDKPNDMGLLAALFEIEAILMHYKNRGALSRHGRPIFSM